MTITGRSEPVKHPESRDPLHFSADETADVGVDEATPVTEEYKERANRFTGRIHKVTVEVK